MVVRLRSIKSPVTDLHLRFLSPLQSRIFLVLFVVCSAEDRNLRLILHPGLSQSDVSPQNEFVVLLAVNAGVARLGAVRLMLDL